MLLGLAACSSIIDQIPTAVGGLPKDAPARAAQPPAFPPVHDLPPARETKVLTPAEQKKLEDELKSVRENQAKRARANSPAGQSGNP